ncbi:hypothetical protein B0H14DRAFT_2558947 [Mycena olivaceomarginata]|nr:hypothetical protein B0H14DRAFT_2558947 [Mycena olivaceomarginata]
MRSTDQRVGMDRVTVSRQHEQPHGSGKIRTGGYARRSHTKGRNLGIITSLEAGIGGSRLSAGTSVLSVPELWVKSKLDIASESDSCPLSRDWVPQGFREWGTMKALTGQKKVKNPRDQQRSTENHQESSRSRRIRDSLRFSEIWTAIKISTMQSKIIVGMQTPNSSQEACEGCQHSWLLHQPFPMDPNDRNYPCRRGACTLTGCAGFTSDIDMHIWEYATPCHCTGTWLSHAGLINAAPGPPSVVPVQMRSHPPPSGSYSMAMDAFHGVPEPVGGNIGTRRAESAACSIPHGPFARALGGHSGPQTPFPGNSTSSRMLNTNVDLVIVIWLMLVHRDARLLLAQLIVKPCIELPGSEHLPPANPARAISISNEQTKLYADRLQAYHLVFTVKVPRVGPIPAAEFSQKIHVHLDTHQLTMPPCPPGVTHGPPDDLHSQPFILLKSAMRAGIYNLKKHLSIIDNQFTYSEFVKISRAFPNPLPNPQGSYPWIWIAPRYGHLIGPVAEFSTPGAPLFRNHPCYGLRLLDTLPAPRFVHSDPLNLECYFEYCPSDDIGPRLDTLMTSIAVAQRPATPPPPPMSSSLIRQRSLQSQVASSGWRVRPRQDDSTKPPHSPIEVSILFFLS